MSRTVFMICMIAGIMGWAAVLPSADFADGAAFVLAATFMSFGGLFLLSLLSKRKTDHFIFAGLVGALVSCGLGLFHGVPDEEVFYYSVIVVSLMILRALICEHTGRFYILPKNRLTTTKSVYM